MEVKGGQGNGEEGRGTEWRWGRILTLFFLDRQEMEVKNFKLINYIILISGFL